jgi:phage terminase small subunit
MNHPKLTPKQQRFVQEYLLDLNAAAAARRAGYSPKVARQQGAENLSKPIIRTAVEAAQKELADRLKLKAEHVLREYMLLAFSDIGDVADFSGKEPRLVDPSAIPPEARRAIASVKIRKVAGTKKRRGEVVTEVRLWDKLNALEKLARHLGLFNEPGGPESPFTVQTVRGVTRDEIIGPPAGGNGAPPAPQR